MSERAKAYVDYLGIEFDDTEITSWLKNEIINYIDYIDDLYTDNIRWCEVGDPISEEDYKISYDQGCCGYADKEVAHKSGRRFKIGFNYGH